MTYQDILKIVSLNLNKILKITVLSVAVIFTVLYFAFPVSFKAPVTVLPPEQNTGMGTLGTLLGSQDLSSLVTGGMSNANSQLYMEILKSRSAAEYVVNKHDLTKYYGEDNKYKAAMDLSDHLELEVNKEGILTLSVETKTSLFPLFSGGSDAARKMSAALSNSYIEALDKINREKLSSKARQARQYIEEQLKATRYQLDSVENRLMVFQKTNKAISLPEQVNAAIKAAADIKTEIVKTEIELGLMQVNLQEDNRALIALKNKLEELKSQYSKMEMGSQDYLVAFKEVPELGKDLASLLREVKIQNEVYIMLQQQYYKEKIQETRDIPTVEILDEAIPPLKAAGPRVIFSSVMGGVFVFLGMCLLLVLNVKKSKKN
jgi:tyrosine-protein kinase Etk/Wzc